MYTDFIARVAQWLSNRFVSERLEVQVLSLAPMIIINTTRNTLLGNDVRVARGFDEKARGLLDSVGQSSIFFQTRWGIHTFGMKFAIDCVVLDDKLKVAAICESMKPNRFFFWWPWYENVLELPAGTISKTRTEVGDILNIH